MEVEQDLGLKEDKCAEFVALLSMSCDEREADQNFLCGICGGALTSLRDKPDRASTDSAGKEQKRDKTSTVYAQYLKAQGKVRFWRGNLKQGGGGWSTRPDGKTLEGGSL